MTMSILIISPNWLNFVFGSQKKKVPDSAFLANPLTDLFIRREISTSCLFVCSYLFRRLSVR